MEDKELLLRFLSFAIRNHSSYKKTQNIDTWLSDTMIIYNSLPSLDSRDIKRSISRGSVNVSDIKILDESTVISNFDMAMSRAAKLLENMLSEKVMELYVEDQSINVCLRVGACY